MTITQCVGSVIHTIPNIPMYGRIIVSASEMVTASRRNLFERNPVLKALCLSDRQFQTTKSFWRVARMNVIILAFASFSAMRAPGSM